MQLKSLHPWDVDLVAATAIQRELAERVITTGEPSEPRLVAGVDVGFPGGVGRAAVVLLSYPELTEVERGVAELPPPFPYVPGFLSFREVPIVAEAFARLTRSPDLVIVDGQGIAHPRGLGIAAHLGLLLDLPTIGCAKSRLVGQAAEPPDERGAWVPLRYRRATVGAVLRTRPGVKPVFISVGHRLSLAAAVEWTLRLTPRFRLPEPIRAAHVAAGSR